MAGLGRGRRSRAAHFWLGIYSDQHVYIARVAESVDAPGLGSGARKGVGVQLPPLAPGLSREFSARPLTSDMAEPRVGLT